MQVIARRENRRQSTVESKKWLAIHDPYMSWQTGDGRGGRTFISIGRLSLRGGLERNNSRSNFALLALCVGLVVLDEQGHRFTAISYLFMICVRIV